MKKFLLFLLFPVLLNAQVEFLGLVQVDTVRYDNSLIYDFLLKFKAEKTKDGSEILFLPEYKVFHNIPRYAMIIEAYFVEYTYDEKNDKVTLESPETYMVQWSLKDKEIKEKKKYNNDNYDSTKPKDLEAKVKKAHKEKKVKAKP